MVAREFESVQAAHEWIREQFGLWPDRPTPAHLDALRSYKGSDYAQINEALRAGDATRFDEPTWLAITEAIAAEAIDQSVVVYRGIDDEEIVELILLGADEIPHKGFVSVSLVEHVAEQFLDDSSDDGNVLLVGVLPIGTAAAPLDFVPDAKHASEAELLLHAGSVFVVESVDTDEQPIRAHGRWQAP